MDEWQKSILSQKVQEIRSEILGGAIYGIPVTGDDIDVMILAAYHLGRAEEMRESSPKMFDMMYTVLGK